MKAPRFLAMCFIAGSYALPVEADIVSAPRVSIEEAIKSGKVLMASHYAKIPQLQCFISKVEYKKETPSGYWRIFWSGTNTSSCFAEVRVANDSEAFFVVGY